MIMSGTPQRAISEGSTTSSNATSAATSPFYLTNSASSSFRRGSQSPRGASLKATILSAYDLPVRDPPSYVQITVGEETVCSGPPVQRHRDRNAFKFATSLMTSPTQPTTPSKVSHHDESSSNTVVMSSLPLEVLYSSTATVQLVYANQSSRTMTTQYPLSQLIIGEKTWLILPLEESEPKDPVKYNLRLDEEESVKKNRTSNGSDANEDDDEDSVRPTLRLQMTLNGPYRPEIAALLHLMDAWFELVDDLELIVLQVLDFVQRALPPLPDVRYLLIPAVPLLAMLVVASPILVGLFVVGIPLFLPLAVLLGTALLLLGAGVLGLAASTQRGRSQVHTLWQPVTQAVVGSPTGQQVVYCTGPRPSPVALTRTLLPKSVLSGRTTSSGLWTKLGMSLGVDACGSATYLLPIVGEGFDLFWAPIQTILIMALYEEASLLKYVSFAEEILPLTDWVPTATLGWLMEFGVPFVRESLGGGRPSRMTPGNSSSSR